jgi:hypothetical protein
MQHEPQNIDTKVLELNKHDSALIHTYKNDKAEDPEIVAVVEGQFDSKQLAQELLEKINIDISEEKIQIISGLIESREKIPDTSEIQSMNSEDLLNLFISLKVSKEYFNFTNRVKYVEKGFTVLRDETDSRTKAQVYLSGVVKDPITNSDKWIGMSELNEDVIKSQLEDIGVDRSPGKRMQIELHIFCPNDATFLSNSEEVKKIIGLAGFDDLKKDFSISIDNLPFSVEEIRSIMSNLDKSRKIFDLDSESPRVNLESTNLHQKLKEILKNNPKNPTSDFINRHLEGISAHIAESYKKYPNKDVASISGYLFEAIVDFELNYSTGELYKSMLKILSDRKENVGASIEISGVVLTAIENLYQQYCIEKRYPHSDKLCISKIGQTKTISGLVEIKNRISDEIPEDHIKQMLKASKHLSAFIAWVNKLKDIDIDLKSKIGYINKTNFSNLVLFIVEPSADGSTVRKLDRQDLKIRLIRSEAQISTIHEISDQLVQALSI